jgi:hypothetical protein
VLEGAPHAFEPGRSNVPQLTAAIADIVAFMDADDDESVAFDAAQQRAMRSLPPFRFDPEAFVIDRNLGVTPSPSSPRSATRTPVRINVVSDLVLKSSFSEEDLVILPKKEGHSDAQGLL